MKLRNLVVAAVAAAALAAGGDVAAAPAAQAGANEYTVVGAGGGVYWRSGPQDTPIVRPGHGVYTGDRVYLNCYSWGGPGPSGNKLWYWAGNLSRNWSSTGAEYGWVNDHSLNTPGTAANPQPVSLPCH